MPDQFSVRCRGSITQRIAAIKAIRGLGGMGLKEAKDIMDSINESDQTIVKPVCADNNAGSNVWISMLQGAGAEVTIIREQNPVRDGISESISGLAAWATTSANYDLARALIDVLETHCPHWTGKEKDDD